MNRTRILLADDHDIVIEGLRRILDRPAFEIVGATRDPVIAETRFTSSVRVSWRGRFLLEQRGPVDYCVFRVSVDGVRR